VSNWIATLSCVMLLFGAPPAHSGRPQPHAVTQGRLAVLTLHGPHYQAGLAHGRALRADIRLLVGLWKQDIHERFRADSDSFLAAFMKATDFLPAIRRWSPGLLEEVRGISDGAGIDFPTMLAYQLVDEIWVMGAGPAVEKCTTVAVRGSAGQPCRIAQNLDIPRFYHRHRVLLRLRDTESGIDQDVLTFPGYLGACGLNSFSVGVGANALPDLKRTTDGLPVCFVVRSVLERRTHGDALAFLRAIRHAAPQNYVLGDAGAVGSFECSDTTVAEFRPFAGASVTYHANRPIASREYTDAARTGLASAGLTVDSYPGNCTRLRFLRRTFGDRAAPTDMARLKRVLRDRASGVNNPTTFASLIMVLTPRPELHLAPGRPDEEPFQVFRFDRKIR
jgi:isopenicillin-N N-acyltransferase like protein